jgi:hypothetical protein
MRDAETPVEPWLGYHEQTSDERRRLLQLRYDMAKMHGDQDYALAIASAVANYEMLTAQTGAGTADGALLAYARELHDDGGSWAPS